MDSMMKMIMNGWQLSDRYQRCYKRIKHGINQSCPYIIWSYETHEGDMYSIRTGKIFVNYANVMLASRGE